MRRYMLASKGAKTDVDLRDYRQIIEDAVHKVLPQAEVKVEVDCYYVEPTPKQGVAIRIGREICKSDLKKYCVQIPKLFCSEEVELEEVKPDGQTKEVRHGGHH